MEGVRGSPDDEGDGSNGRSTPSGAEGTQPEDQVGSSSSSSSSSEEDDHRDMVGPVKRENLGAGGVPYLEVGNIRCGYTERYDIKGEEQMLHWVVKNTRTVIPIRVIGDTDPVDILNHYRLRVTLHYAIPGHPLVNIPTDSEADQPFTMHALTTKDGRAAECDCRFRILSSQHRNARFLLHFWVETASGDVWPGLSVMTNPFVMVSKKKQIHLKRGDRHLDDLLARSLPSTGNVRRSSRKRAEVEYDDVGDEVLHTEREDEEEEVEQPQSETKSKRARHNNDEVAISQHIDTGNAPLPPPAPGVHTTIVVDQALHGRIDVMDNLLRSNRTMLDRILAYVSKAGPPPGRLSSFGGSGSAFSSGLGVRQAPADADAAEAIAQLSFSNLELGSSFYTPPPPSMLRGASALRIDGAEGSVMAQLRASLLRLNELRLEERRTGLRQLVQDPQLREVLGTLGEELRVFTPTSNLWMPIIYSCVALGATVLAEHSSATSNASSIVKIILEKLEWQDGMRKSYTYDEHMFHIACSHSPGLTVLCMSDVNFERRRAHAFLDDVRNRFSSTYGRPAANVRPLAMQSDFGRVLQKQADFFSFDPSSDKITAVREEVNKTKQVMVDSIDKVLQRGERIELLVQQTDNLQQSSVRFSQGANKLKFALWRKNVILTVGIVVVSLFALWLILSLACGFDFHKCGAGGGSATTVTPSTVATTTAAPATTTITTATTPTPTTTSAPATTASK